MNFKDIALLKYENLKGDTLEFYRAKTMNTAKGDLRPVKVYLTEFAISIIDAYGNQNAKPGDYIFDIISKDDAPIEQHRK